MVADTDILPPPRDEGGACPSVRCGQPVLSWLVCGLGKEEGTRLRRPYGGNCERPRRAGEKTKSMMISTTRARTLFLLCLGKRRSSTFGKQQQRHGPFLPQSLPFCHAHCTSQFNSPGVLSRHTPLLHPRELSVAFRQGDKEQSAVKQARQRHGPAQVVFPAQDRFSLSSSCTCLQLSSSLATRKGLQNSSFDLRDRTDRVHCPTCRWRSVATTWDKKDKNNTHTQAEESQKKGVLSNTIEQQSLCPINQNIILGANNNLHTQKTAHPHHARSCIRLRRQM